MSILEEMQGRKQMAQSLQRHIAHLIEGDVGWYRKVVSLKRRVGPWRGGHERSKDRDAV